MLRDIPRFQKITASHCLAPFISYILKAFRHLGNKQKRARMPVYWVTPSFAHPLVAQSFSLFAITEQFSAIKQNNQQSPVKQTQQSR